MNRLKKNPNCKASSLLLSVYYSNKHQTALDAAALVSPCETQNLGGAGKDAAAIPRDSADLQLHSAPHRGRNAILHLSTCKLNHASISLHFFCSFTPLFILFPFEWLLPLLFKQTKKDYAYLKYTDSNHPPYQSLSSNHSICYLHHGICKIHHPQQQIYI